MAAGSVKRRTYKRKDGSTREVWRAQVPDPSRGGAHKIERQFATKREAQRWVTAQRSAVQRGEWIDPADGQRTFSKVAEEWRAAAWPGLGPRTQYGYESLLNQLNDRFGKAQVSAIHADATQAYINELAASRKTPTVRHYLTVLSQVMRVAVERRYIAANPCDAVRLPRGQRGPEQLFLTPEEVAALAEAIDPHYRVAIYVAAYMGLRAGELWALRRDDIDLLHGTLRVDESVKDVGGRVVFGDPKTGKSVRTISLPKAIRDLLAGHLAVETSSGTGPDALVFTTPRGDKPIRHGNFYRRHFKATVERGWCAECGEEVASGAEACPGCGAEEFRWVLPPAKHGLRFHDLRHTCASLSLAVTPNLHMVMRRLGHSSITTTVDKYGHLVPDLDSAIADGLDGLFAKVSAPAGPSNVAELRPG